MKSEKCAKLVALAEHPATPQHEAAAARRAAGAVVVMPKAVARRPSGVGLSYDDLISQIEKEMARIAHAIEFYCEREWAPESEQSRRITYNRARGMSGIKAAMYWEDVNAANVATSTQFLDALRRSVHNDGPSEKMLAVLRSIEVCRMLGVTIGGKKIRDGISLPSEEAASRTYSDMVRAGWIR